MADSDGGPGRGGGVRLSVAPPPPPRSVEFRAEIGSLPARDRFTSGSRSVRFRTEIGPRPRRRAAGERPQSAWRPGRPSPPAIRSLHGEQRRSAHRTGRVAPPRGVRPQRRDGAVRSLGGGAHIDAGLTGAGTVPHEAHPHLARARCRQNERPALGVDGARHLIGASLAPQSLDVRGQPPGVLAAGLSQSSGASVTTAPATTAQTAIDFLRGVTARPSLVPVLMRFHRKPPCLVSSPLPSPPTSVSRTDLDAELDRSRRGTEPISTRNSTDLGAEVNRSRDPRMSNDEHMTPARGTMDP